MANAPVSEANATVNLTGDVVEDRLEALKAFERVSRQFAIGFNDSEPEAYGNLLRDLMDNSALFVSGGLMSAKEVLDKIEDLQTHIKKGGTQGKSVTDVFHGWMNGGDAA
jgi:hypothetical protein